MKKARKILPLFLFPCILLFFLLQISAVIEGVRSALALCAYSIIPSLFVFLVLSDIITNLLISEKRISPKWSVFLLGSLCGFPVGAIACEEYYSAGALTKEDATKLATVCNTASPAFIIGAIGNTLLQDKALGCILYLAQLLITFLFVMPLHIKPITPCNKLLIKPGNRFFLSLEKAVKNILQICALICLFSACLSICKDFFHERIFLFLSILLEIGNGVSIAARQKTAFAVALCGFACGWSGICVHFQIFSVLKSIKVNKQHFFFYKFLQGILTAVLAFCGYKLFLLLNFQF